MAVPMFIFRKDVDKKKRRKGLKQRKVSQSMIEMKDLEKVEQDSVFLSEDKKKYEEEEEEKEEDQPLIIEKPFKTECSNHDEDK